MKTAVIYVRSATANEESVQTQIELCKQCAAQKGFTVIAVYPDAIAGKETSRPAFKRMLSEIKKWDVLIIRNLSRISSKAQVVYHYVTKIKKFKKEIVSVTEGVIDDDFYNIMKTIARVSRRLSR